MAEQAPAPAAPTGTTEPTATAAAAAPEAPPAPAAAAESSDADESIVIPKKSFNARLEREVAKRFEKHGIKGFGDIEKLAEQEAERQKAQMTELDRARTEVEAARARAAAAEAERDAERFNAQLVGACSQRGIKNASYARYLIDEARKADPEADIGAVLEQHLADETAKVALGVAAPAPTTTAAPSTTPATVPPKPSMPNGSVDVLKMSKEDWNAYKRDNNLM